ncbi:MAG: [protein-PII] uridylyltransferase [Burkholderiaceae bacterium]|nr:[protein-PII] uridylyltransferase [Burkholderiaceae bacterium]
MSSTASDFRQRKTELLSRCASAQSLSKAALIHQHLKLLSDLCDDTLKSLWQNAGMPEHFALLAVGGYGRQALFPYSDVDVLVLLPDDLQLESDETLKARIEGFIGSCWDAGLEIGSSVRQLHECLSEAAADITVQTAMLESRWLVGDTALMASFNQAFKKQLDPRAFFTGKTLEMQQRHSKFDNSPYSLEPNCKESPGGLRDLQMLLWLTKASGLGSTWQDLSERGMVTALEMRQLKRNENLLSLLRWRLHWSARRREDRLVFDMQSTLAIELGLAADTQDAKRARAASEALMKHYYWAAKAVTQLNQIIHLNIEDWLFDQGHAHPPQPLNERFLDKSGMLEVVDDGLYQRQPHAILETFWVYQETVGIKGLSARTLRALYNARGLMNAAFRRDPANRAMFMRILQTPQGITHAMRLMNQTSVLGRYLWVFRRIVGQMQHDLFHVYTVDQHILMVLRNVRRFFIVEHAHEYPFCSQLAAGWEQPWILYVAALFHDIAKGRGGDHSDLGAKEVRLFCRQHGVAKADQQLIEFLVKHHLTMSHVAQKEDLSDPDVIRAFANKVGNERYLRALYLLTVADIRGTSPKVWNAWKGKLLEDLYRASAAVLGGQSHDPHALVEMRKREALETLNLYAMPFESHKDLWDTLDVGYFMRHEAADIAWHTRQLSRPLALAKAAGQSAGVTVKARLSPLGEGLQVMVYTPDQPDLFARICGYFDQAEFSIQDAKVHTAKNGYALDTFQVVTPMLNVHYRELTPMVENGLKEAIENGGPLHKPRQGGRVSRRVKSFPVAPRVRLQPDEKAQRWLLSISASDRAGLLYGVAQVLAQHHINVLLAKVSTLGERVEDTFLIDGAALQHNRTQIDLETQLLDVLGAAAR